MRNTYSTASVRVPPSAYIRWLAFAPSSCAAFFVGAGDVDVGATALAPAVVPAPAFVPSPFASSGRVLACRPVVSVDDVYATAVAPVAPGVTVAVVAVIVVVVVANSKVELGGSVLGCPRLEQRHHAAPAAPRVGHGLSFTGLASLHLPLVQSPLAKHVWPAGKGACIVCV